MCLFKPLPIFARNFVPNILYLKNAAIKILVIYLLHILIYNPIVKQSGQRLGIFMLDAASAL